MDAKWACLLLLLQLGLLVPAEAKALGTASSEEDTDDGSGTTPTAWKLEDYFSGVNVLDKSAATSLLSTITSLTRPSNPATLLLPPTPTDAADAASPSSAKGKGPGVSTKTAPWAPPPGGFAAYFARLTPTPTPTRTAREAEADSFSKANLKKRSPGVLLPYLAMAAATAATAKPADSTATSAAAPMPFFPGMPPLAPMMGASWPYYMPLLMKPSLKKMMLWNMMSQMAAAAQPTPAPSPPTTASSADSDADTDSSEFAKRALVPKTMKASATTKDGSVGSPDLWMWDPVLLKQLLGGEATTTEPPTTTIAAPDVPPNFWMVEDMGAIDPSVFVSSKMAYLEKVLESLSPTSPPATTTAAPATTTTTKKSKPKKEKEIATTVATPTDAEILQQFLEALSSAMKPSPTPPPKKVKPAKLDKKLSKIKGTTTPAPTAPPTVDPEAYIDNLLKLLRDSAADADSSIETRAAKMGPMAKPKKKDKTAGKYSSPLSSTSSGLTEEQQLLKQLLDVIGPSKADAKSDKADTKAAAKSDAKAAKKAKKFYAKGPVSMEDIFDDDSYEKRAVVDAKKNATTTIPLNFWVPPPLLMDPAYYLNKKIDFLSNILDALSNATNSTDDSMDTRMVKPAKAKKPSAITDSAPTPTTIKINSAVMMDPTFLLDKKVDFLDKFFQDLLAAEMNETTSPTMSRASRAIKPTKADKKSKAPPAAASAGPVPPGYFMSKKMDFLSKIIASKANATTTTPLPPTDPPTSPISPPSPAMTFGLMLEANLQMMTDMFQKVMGYKNSLMGTLTSSIPAAPSDDESSSSSEISTRKIKDPLAPTDPLANFDILESLLDKMTEFKKKLSVLSAPPEAATTTTTTTESSADLVSGRASLSPGLQAMVDAMASYRTKVSSMEDDGSGLSKRSPVPDPAAGATPAPLDSKAVLMELDTMGKVLERLSSFQKKLAKMNATTTADDGLARREATPPPESSTPGLFGSAITPEGVVAQMDAMDKILARLAAFKKSLAAFAGSKRAADPDPTDPAATTDTTTFNPVVAAEEMAAYAKFMKSYADFQKKMAVITNPTTPSPFTLAKKAFFANLFTPPALSPPASAAARSVRSVSDAEH